MDKRPIGVFDSGVGGLTVVKQVMKVLPNEDIIYFGDTARVPYGSKSKETVKKFSSQIIRFLITKEVKAIIIACNTVSSNCYEELTEEFDIPIIEVVGPGVSSCVSITKNKKVGVIGTEATIRSKAYEKKLKAIDSEISVYSKACPLFVPIAEEGLGESEIAVLTAKEYLKELVQMNIDCIILGCTHYPLLKSCIAKVVGENVKIVDPAMVTAQKMKSFLKENNMLNDKKGGDYCFYASDVADNFDSICTTVLNRIYKAKQADIEKY